MRPVAATLPSIAAKAIGKRGFAEASLITDWATIVGDQLATVSQPDRLSFPPGKRAGGVLHIRVQSGGAIELQHLEPLVVERINSHFGYGAIARLKLVHAPLTRQATPRARQENRDTPPDPAHQAILDQMLAGVADNEVRAALERLGAAILHQESKVK
ncbi:MAG: DUF721 domain-containing protein [Alphaproteobacteria bacterium]|nr:DUF721 domain-containing protein [Alphaproteobacteria bacterium]